MGTRVNGILAGASERGTPLVLHRTDKPVRFPLMVVLDDRMEYGLECMGM